MSRPPSHSRRTPRPERQQEYGAVPPQSPSGPSLAPTNSRRQTRSRSSAAGPRSPPPPQSSNAHRHRQHHAGSQAEMAQGVARGSIGLGYGPYAYHPDSSRDAEMYTSSRYTRPPPSERTAPPEPSEKAPVPVPVPVPLAPPTTTTIPQYLWDKDPDFDDAIHNPDPIRDAQNNFTIFSSRGWLNAGAMVILVAALLGLFVGYPIFIEFSSPTPARNGFNMGGINASGQIPDLPNLPSLIDRDTPEDARTRTGNDGHKYNLIFSDEFETDGRSFYPGDDPYWEGMDYHYWPTGDLEWYDPGAITTQDGKLVITMTEETIHGMNFKSGMLQSWNKFCFTTGYIEVSISMPGSPRIPGLWPGAWTMGNLGRAGYGATTEGMWPYSYDTCDRGSFPAQTDKDGVPAAAATGGSGDGPLSELPGQKLSACTCPDSDHPGPRTNMARNAPEIDIIEHQIDLDVWKGEVSQSFQVAPFNYKYNFDRSSPATMIYNESITKINTYLGGSLQQAVSAVTHIEDQFYDGQAYAAYGFEYWSDPNNREDGYITWYSNGQPTWTITAASVGPDETTQIDRRIISEEPMYIILNLGMAHDFQAQDFMHLTFPSKMYIDYVRVYQREGVREGVGCSPSHHPTAQYIEDHDTAYANPNFTTWGRAGYAFPRNSEYDGC